MLKTERSQSWFSSSGTRLITVSDGKIRVDCFTVSLDELEDLADAADFVRKMMMREEVKDDLVEAEV